MDVGGGWLAVGGCDVAALASGVGVGVGDVAAVPRRHRGCWWWAVGGWRLAVVMWRRLLSSLTPSSVSTTISPHEQWLVGWVVVLCRGGSSVGWCLDDYVVKRNNL